MFLASGCLSVARNGGGGCAAMADEWGGGGGVATVGWRAVTTCGGWGNSGVGVNS